MDTRKLVIVLTVVCLFFSFFTGHILSTSFEATPSDKSEYGSWDVSEHVRDGTGDEAEWIYMHPASWNFNAVTETLQSNMSNGDYEFSAALVNNSWANRTQSLLWANYTLNTDEDCIFVGPVYACHDNGSFDMVLYGEYYIFLLSWDGTNLVNTEDRTLVEDINDAINYWSGKTGGYSPNGAFGDGIYIKTLYNTLCGGLFTKYWGESSDFMDEPSIWSYEGNVSGNIQTDEAVRWGVAWWAPDVTETITIDYDYMNMWRLNYTTINDEDFAPSDYRPFMSFPIVNMSESIHGDEMVEFFLYYFMGGDNIEDDEMATFLYDFTERMNLESRMYHPNHTGDFSQNDTVYYYSATLTNLAEYMVENFGDEFFPEPDDLEWIPNNVLWLFAQGCPYGDVGNDYNYEYIFISIDTEDDGIWDATDRAFYTDSGGNIGSWTGTDVDDDPYGVLLGETFGDWSGYGFFPCIHRYANHLNYWMMIPLDWLVNGKTGNNLDIGDTFGLHIQTGSMSDSNVCVWENWNETACQSFVDESNVSVFDTYMNNTDIYDEDEGGGLDLTINTTALGYWGGGGIAGDAPLPPDSYGVNITIESNETDVSSGWNETHDVNFTVDIENTGDGEVTNIMINGTWWNCSCSYWNATLLDTNIDVADFSFTPCHFIINDADYSSLAGGASHEFWFTVRFDSCDDASDYRPLTFDVNITTDEGNEDGSNGTIHWGRNSSSEEEGGTIPPGSGDTDGDGLSDDAEVIIGTDIHLPDTDFDGYTDYEEYLAGTDPLDYNNHPGMGCWLCVPFLFIPFVLWMFIIIPAILAFLAILVYCRRQEKKKRKWCYIALISALLLSLTIGIIIYLFMC